MDTTIDLFESHDGTLYLVDFARQLAVEVEEVRPSREGTFEKDAAAWASGTWTPETTTEYLVYDVAPDGEGPKGKHYFAPDAPGTHCRATWTPDGGVTVHDVPETSMAHSYLGLHEPPTTFHVWAHIEGEAPGGMRYHEAHEPEKLVTFTGPDAEEEAREYVRTLRPFLEPGSLVAEIHDLFEEAEISNYVDTGEALALLRRAADALIRPAPAAAAPGAAEREHQGQEDMQFLKWLCLTRPDTFADYVAEWEEATGRAPEADDEEVGS